MNFQNRLIIAVDFDGTIVDDAYPKIGKTRIFAFETLKRLQEDGHRLILWTYRSDIALEEAVEFCKQNLARYKAPKSVAFFSSLPKTGSGKIYKKGLRDEYLK